MKTPKNEIIRYETNTDLKDQKSVKTKNAYVPIMKVPNIFRRLYGYGVYHKEQKSGGSAF